MFSWPLRRDHLSGPFGRIDDAQFRTIHGHFRLDAFAHDYVIEIRVLLLILFGNQNTRNSRAAFGRGSFDSTPAA